MKSQKFFIRQRQVTLLYRDFIKKTSQIKDYSTKQEQKEQIRNEFESNLNIPDENIDYYQAKGTHKLTELDSMLKFML